MADLLARYGWLSGLGGTLCLVAVGPVLTQDGGRLRDGEVLLLLVIGAAAWMACLVGSAYVHGDRDSLTLWAGVSLASLGLVAWAAGWAGFFIGGIGSGESASLTGWLVFTAIALGAIGAVVGLAVFGAGAVRAKVLPWWGRITPLVMAAVLPAAVFINNVRGERSVLLNGLALAVFGLGWIVLGVATRLIALQGSIGEPAA